MVEWRHLVQKHRRRCFGSQDAELKQLLADRRATPAGQRWDVDKKIWRQSRRLKRLRAGASLEKAAMTKSINRLSPRTHINLHKVFGNDAPVKALDDYLISIHSLEASERAVAVSEKDRYIDMWRSLQIVLGSFHLSSTLFDECISKFKLGKSSSV